MFFKRQGSKGSEKEGDEAVTQTAQDDAAAEAEATPEAAEDAPEEKPARASRGGRKSKAAKAAEEAKSAEAEEAPEPEPEAEAAEEEAEADEPAADDEAPEGDEADADDEAPSAAVAPVPQCDALAPHPFADRLVKALRGEPVDRTPVWVMRQAGRYLPEYRALRERADFLTLCKTPELACEATLQPIRRFELDAAILFSDILVPVESMGASVVFEERRGPVLQSPVRDKRDVDALRVPEIEESCGYVLDAIKMLREALGARPLIGFSGAPFTLASYLVEGGGSRNYLEIKRMMFQAREVFDQLMGTLSQTVTRYLIAQANAGVQALQLFDTWAGVLSPKDYAEYVKPHTAGIIAEVKKAVGDEIPLVHFCRGTAGLLSQLKDLGADALGVDWTSDIAAVRAEVGDSLSLQGNLDPVQLYGSAEQIQSEVKRIVAAAGNQRHVFNLGHGILPTTPIEGMEILVAAVQEHGAGTAG